MEGHDRQSEQLSPEITTILMATRPTIPAGFALRARQKFERALAVRRLRRWITGSVSLFVLTSLMLWGLIFNVLNIGVSVWQGVLGGMAIIRFLFTLWDHVPLLGVGFALVIMVFNLTIWAVVGKLDQPALTSK